MTISLPVKIITIFLNANRGLGIVSATCIFTMMCTQTATVVYRYVLSEGSIALQESALYAHATAFMIAMGFAFHHDKHVRVDVFYRKMTRTQKRWVNTLGFSFCLVPLCVTLVYVGIPFVEMAWSIREQSQEAGGLTYLYILKTLIVIMPITALMGGASQLALEWLGD